MTSDDVYALSALATDAARGGFPIRELSMTAAYELVHDELMLDGMSRMNLATFCTTWLDDSARRLMAETLDKNIVDKDEYPQTAELERRCVRMLADLWHAPDPGAAIGTSTTGSSEAAMLGGLAAKFRWRAEGRGSGRPNFVCGPVQVCWEKFARYFDVEIRQVALHGDRYMMSPSDAVALCDENTIMVVPTFGQTFTGFFEDVAGLSAALDDLASRGPDIPIHVDAASGGFLAPFTAPELVWDFRLPRVKSLNASGHKTGLAPLGVGWALWRTRDDLPAELVFNVDYLGGNMPTFNLNFSRPGGQAIASYYQFIRLGRDGYTRLQNAIHHVAQHLALGLAALGPFEIIHDGRPERGISAVSWSLTGDHPFNLYDLSDKLRSRGWLVAAYPLPADRQDETIMRVVVRHGFSRDMADLFLADVQRCLDQLAAHPPSSSLTHTEARSFSHDASPAVGYGLPPQS